MTFEEVTCRRFGATDLFVSEVGFGAWAIGGSALAGSLPIGWGKTDDGESMRALETAFDLGITFYDTADFYGLGHSERLIGRVFGNRPDVVVATKVGHRLRPDGSIYVDYSREHLLSACDESLKRLRRDAIDYYQLHTAKVAHLESGEAAETMERLREQGKIRFWGVSLNTYRPEPEADFLLAHGQGDGFQLVLNVMNQGALEVTRRASAAGYGIIARMPLQFGLLAGKFGPDTRFASDDHRSFRLRPDTLAHALSALGPFFDRARSMGVDAARLALSYVLSYPEVSTVIPGIRTVRQARMNAAPPVKMSADVQSVIEGWYRDGLAQVLAVMREAESAAK